jgi:hypothetical protein
VHATGARTAAVATAGDREVVARLLDGDEAAFRS